MNFDRSEEQQLVAASIARFVERDYTFAIRRGIVASTAGCSDDVWRTLAELGLLGLTLPAADGGLGGGARGATRGGRGGAGSPPPENRRGPPFPGGARAGARGGRAWVPRRWGCPPMPSSERPPARCR